MTVNFCDHFWGEKCNGFDVLYHNMKYGQIASKELADFFRERCTIEEAQSKLLSKLAKQAGNCNSNGTFAPIWQLLKSSSEKLSTFHQQMVQKFQELMKEVTKYCEEQQKKHKAVKDEEASTLEIVQTIQSTTGTLIKAKEIYNQRCLEYEKLKRDNASPKEIEKSEIKYKKAGEDYRSLVEKYTTVRDEFEKKMTIACRHFQDVEEDHLKKMKLFLETYTRVLETGHSHIGQVYVEFKQQCSDTTVEKLLEQLVQAKSTGLDRPGPIEFEEADLSSLSSAPSSVGETGAGERTTNGERAPKKEGFLSRLDRKKRKRRGELSNKENNLDNKDTKDDQEGSSTPTLEITEPKVDDEGFTIRPESDIKDADKGSFYSSSGSDTDEEKEKKIHIEIKPLTNGSAPLSASIDELRASVGGLVISPVGGYSSSNRRTPTNELESPMKRSVSQQIGKPSNDLLGLSFHQSPAPSSASTPTGAYGGSTSSPTSTGTGTSAPSPISVGSGGRRSDNSTPTPTPTKYEELGDLFSELGGDLPPALPPKHSTQTQQQQVQTTTSRSGTPMNSSLIIPRPPSRPRVDSAVTRGRASPSSPMSRAESVSSLSSDFRSSSMSVGSSRGPSPLTIGMSDTIPLAIAFQETVHAVFRGTDETMCQVKLTGDMILSFPAGIVQVLANNPIPAVLSFRLKNTTKLGQMLPNNQLISHATHSNGDNYAYEFNMAAVAALLRRQAEQNPAASYYNVDILKYQINAQPNAESTPLQLVAYWKCETSNTDLRLDYKYNGAAMTSPLPLLNLSIYVPVDGGVTAMQSKPNGAWIAETQRAMWRFTELSQHSDNGGMGSVRARFELKSGPSCPGTIAAQFSCEGTTFSGAEFELIGSGYRVSLIKRRFITGKYVCETEPDMKNRYAPPP